MSKLEFVERVLAENNIRPETRAEAVRVLEKLGLPGRMERFQRLNCYGMTNALFTIGTAAETYLIRLPGVGTEHIVDRRHEKAVYEALRGSHISDELLYISGETGIKITGYLKDYHICDPNNPDDVRRCVRKIRELHSLGLEVPHVFDVFAEIWRYEQECDFPTDRFPDFTTTRERVLSLRPLLEAGMGERCLCHIDANYDNCLMNDRDVRLIDWEYAGMSDPCIDVAMFNIYAGFEKERADWTIAEYLGEEDSPDARMRVYANMSAGAYLWVLWCEIKRKGGVEYREYEEGQYHLAKTFYRYAAELRRNG